MQSTCRTAPVTLTPAPGRRARRPRVWHSTGSTSSPPSWRTCWRTPGWRRRRRRAPASCADLSERHLRCAGRAQRILRRRVRHGGQLRPAGGLPARHQPRHRSQVHRGQRQHLPPQHPQVSTHYLLDIYTLSTQYLRSAECATQDLLLSWFQSWEGINDESCLAEHPAGERGCVR